MVCWGQRVTQHSQTLDYPACKSRHVFQLTSLENVFVSELQVCKSDFKQLRPAKVHNYAYGKPDLGAVEKMYYMASESSPCTLATVFIRVLVAQTFIFDYLKK